MGRDPSGLFPETGSRAKRRDRAFVTQRTVKGNSPPTRSTKPSPPRPSQTAHPAKPERFTGQFTVYRFTRANGLLSRPNLSHRWNTEETRIEQESALPCFVRVQSVAVFLGSEVPGTAQFPLKSSAKAFGFRYSPVACLVSSFHDSE